MGYAVSAVIIAGVEYVFSGGNVVDKVTGGGNQSSKDLQQFEKLKADYASKEIPNADSVGNALKNDASHRAASFVPEEQLAQGRVNSFTGADNKSYTLLQTKGGLDGQNGVYEYIMNSSG